MIKRDTFVLVNIGMNIIAAALCIPVEFFWAVPVFYRTIILFVVNILISEIPNWKNIPPSKHFFSRLQFSLYILAFVLIAFSVINLAHPTPDEITLKVKVVMWVHFLGCLLLLFLIIINNLDFSNKDSQISSIPSVRPLTKTEK